ncbi:hypothetical protein HNY73_001343 [Argiope bruennichi]|uniref:Uncharacterized protein n=1 Tax=Argiope bruennichi TaxID=94029 RepID=A0A8T0G578_ARGBR|nr:hypothetical protein HNY73_001343 [Argiope bruennichi]
MEKVHRSECLIAKLRKETTPPPNPFPEFYFLTSPLFDQVLCSPAIPLPFLSKANAPTYAPPLPRSAVKGPLHLTILSPVLLLKKKQRQRTPPGTSIYYQRNLLVKLFCAVKIILKYEVADGLSATIADDRQEEPLEGAQRFLFQENSIFFVSLP